VLWNSFEILSKLFKLRVRHGCCLHRGPQCLARLSYRFPAEFRVEGGAVTGQHASQWRRLVAGNGTSDHLLRQRRRGFLLVSAYAIRL